MPLFKSRFIVDTEVVPTATITRTYLIRRFSPHNPRDPPLPPIVLHLLDMYN